ncbi:MAG: cytidylate kinase-like family protein [Lachnospiraceae bacterium]|nr:cytidylate kinase-like family protein [Lachnospiraceae bacterium]
MKEQLIVALGREYGSGGREIARQISERLGITFYDRNMLDHMFEDEEQRDAMSRYDEGVKMPFIHRTVRGFSNSVEENLAEMQFEFLRNKAASGESFVIVGRCGESVLKGIPGLVSIFVLGDMYQKICRIMEVYKVNEAQAIEKIGRHDRTRKRYHNNYSEIKWGDSRGYDITINSSKLGIDNTAEFLYEYILRRREGGVK